MKISKLPLMSTICAFTFFANFTYTQILTIDRENGQDSIQKKIRASFVLNFSSDKQKITSSILQINQKSTSLQKEIKFLFC